MKCASYFATQNFIESVKTSHGMFYLQIQIQISWLVGNLYLVEEAATS